MSVVPHTHWDREWYAPFQTFRLLLVDLLDDLLPAMEADPSYAHFLLDGQMAVVDDYLAVRPQAEQTLRRLAVSGRLAMGPWYVLMDELLVSGETMVRNLQRGLDRAAAFGGAMEVGYLPDMFGHVAQMPQLLRQFGFEHAVVWRGVPASVDRTAFTWVAPDGSAVRAEYLPGGYGNGAGVPDDAKAFLARVESQLDELGDRLRPDDTLLWMNGTDHQMPQPWLGRVVAEANALTDAVQIGVVPLAEHLATAPVDGLPTVAGELRSGARANLLMGVASNRVDVRAAAARAERALERRAEPLCALFLDPGRWPETLLAEAWLGVIRNSAHDSVCACSADDVVDAVLVRYAEAGHIADGLAARALEQVAAVVTTDGPVVVNSSARTRGGVVELVLPGEGPVEGAQLLARRPALVHDTTVAGADVAEALEILRSQQFDVSTYVNAFEVLEGDDGVDVVFAAGDRLRDNLLVEEVKAGIVGLAASRPDTPFRIRVEQPPTRRVAVRVPPVPGFGWAAWEAAPLDVEPVRVQGTALSNGLVAVEVDPADGTFSLGGVSGLDRLVDGGDAGDTYNYGPPDDDIVVDEPDRVEVTVLEGGPVRGRVRVTRRYRWPVQVDDEQRARVGERPVNVTTTLEVRAGEPLVRVTTEFDNPVRDHRLRTHFPLPRRAATLTAETAYGTVERGTTAEGGPTEVALPTSPALRFVQAGGLTVVHDGVGEHELVELDADGTAGELAFTLLRATGMLSRVELTYRPLPAGPPVPLEGPQLQRRIVRRYAVAVGEVDPWALADDLLLPLDVVTGVGMGTAPASGSVLEVTGAEVTSLVRRGGELELRVCNPTSSTVTVAVAGRSGWLVDLRGRPVEPFAGSFELRPWGIATARLSPGSSPRGHGRSDRAG